MGRWWLALHRFCNIIHHLWLQKEPWGLDLGVPQSQPSQENDPSWSIMIHQFETLKDLPLEIDGGSFKSSVAPNDWECPQNQRSKQFLAGAMCNCSGTSDALSGPQSLPSSSASRGVHTVAHGKTWRFDSSLVCSFARPPLTRTSFWLMPRCLWHWLILTWHWFEWVWHWACLWGLSRPLCIDLAWAFVHMWVICFTHVLLFMLFSKFDPIPNSMHSKDAAVNTAGREF